MHMHTKKSNMEPVVVALFNTAVLLDIELKIGTQKGREETDYGLVVSNEILSVLLVLLLCYIYITCYSWEKLGEPFMRSFVLFLQLSVSLYFKIKKFSNNYTSLYLSIYLSIYLYLSSIFMFSSLLR